jgi:hypothetical protein
VGAVCLRCHDWQHLKATYIGFDTRGNQTAGSGAFNHETHFFSFIELQAKDDLVNDVLIGACGGSYRDVGVTVLVVGHGRRQLLWFAVTRHRTAEWLAQQITEAFPWNFRPTYLVRDNDGAYGHAFTRRLRTMGIRDRPMSPFWPDCTIAMRGYDFREEQPGSKAGTIRARDGRTLMLRASSRK